MKTAKSPDGDMLPFKEAFAKWNELAKPLEDAGFLLNAFDPGLQFVQPGIPGVISLPTSAVRRINAAIAGEPTKEMREQLDEISAQTFDEWAAKLQIPRKERPTARQAWEYAHGLGYFQGRVDAEHEQLEEQADEQIIPIARRYEAEETT
jgi:hypothetical protein